MPGRLRLLIFALLLSAVPFSRQMPFPQLASGAAASPEADESQNLGEHSSPGSPLAPDGDNEQIQGRILKALRAQPSLANSSFEVKVSDSKIELSGSVPTAREKETARRIAQSYGNNRNVGDAQVIVRNAIAHSPQR